MHEDGGTDSLRSIIQEEMKKTKNQDNNETMKQMLMMIEMKHSTELGQANRERDVFKMRADHLRKQLEEFQKNKKAGDKSEKIKDLLTCLAQLRLQPNEITQNASASTSTSATASAFTRSPLPWMDPDKCCPLTQGDNHSARRGNSRKYFRGHHGGQRGFKRGGGQRGFNRSSRGICCNHNKGPVHQLQEGFNRDGNCGSTSFDGQVTLNYRNHQARFSRCNQMQYRGRGYNRRSHREGGRAGRAPGRVQFQMQENPLSNPETENKKKKIPKDEEPIKCCICC